MILQVVVLGMHMRGQFQNEVFFLVRHHRGVSDLCLF